MDEHEKWRNEVKVGVDLGTSKLAVSFTFPGSPKVQLLKFSSSLYAQKKVEELDAVLGYAPSGWHYGPDVKVLDDAIAFSNIKLGIIGHEPYLSLLKGSFRAAAKKYGVKETPVTLFQKLFSHILATLKRLFDQPENQHYYGGRTFRDLEKSCSVTYPVRQNGSLKIVLVEAALAAGFHRVNGVSEPLAAAHYIVLQPQPIISCNETFLIIDCGGGTFDLATVERRSDGGIRQVCPTDGFPSGGETVNDTARAYLLGLFGDEQNLKDDHKWSTKVSPGSIDAKGPLGKEYR
ncbi:hypothetical protein N7471_010773 [Penicillium samsonianum]|uniref:uncharacterized protein n=1 Tax=Penicillium samsonianum TaxID=1882272 RepID=UPI002547BB86|nr:uncharacterized protein N7471_010773 [Penicillium samsonianum]KAJ6126280.1 hypothetical protein N7471_010773 [Penicillium samsonianum]